MSIEQPPRVNRGPYAFSPASSFALDVIRVAAAQTVLIGHSLDMLGLLPGARPPNFVYIQNVAVAVFFILSGLLISYSLLSRPQKPTFETYFLDRFSRLYVGLLPALFVIAAIDGALLLSGYEYAFWNGYSITDFVGNVLMMQDFPVLGEVLGITSFGSGRVLWTLAVEWWIYMLFGWTLLMRGSSRFWIGFVLLLPVPLYNLGGRGDGLTVMWGLGVLCCLALRSNRAHIRRRSVGWSLVSFFTVLAAIRICITKDAYDLLFAALAAGALFALLLTLDAGKPDVPERLRRSVKVCADYSFTLYLLHLSVARAVMAASDDMNSWGKFCLIVVISNCVSALVAMPTEMRHSQFRDFLKGRSVHLKEQR